MSYLSEMSDRCPGLWSRTYQGLSDKTFCNAVIGNFLVAGAIAIILGLTVAVAQGETHLTFSQWTPLEKTLCFAPPVAFVAGNLGIFVVNGIARWLEMQKEKAYRKSRPPKQQSSSSSDSDMEIEMIEMKKMKQVNSDRWRNNQINMDGESVSSDERVTSSEEKVNRDPPREIDSRSPSKETHSTEESGTDSVTTDESTSSNSNDSDSETSS